jgi:hypothetical protein
MCAVKGNDRVTANMMMKPTKGAITLIDKPARIWQELLFRNELK